MCGIAGFFHFQNDRLASLDVIRKMTDVLSHRGPDGEGFFVRNNIALGHRRLSIIDLQSGEQPMYNDDRSLVIILNGEIYNYIELRNELIKLGYNFRTTSDTEVALKAYEHWGVECLQKLNGMWAFAIWDERKNELFLSRDRIGEKPLFYSANKESFVFGSEIKSLFAFGLNKEIAAELLELYLFLTNIPTPYTFFRNIFKLRPGHYMTISGGTVREFKYWDLPEIDESDMNTDKNDVYEQFRYLLEDSVRIRMRSDVDFGAFLSGGLDSSTVVTIMSEISASRVNTFTIGFNDRAFDERALARSVAELNKTKHHENTVEPGEFHESLKKVCYHFDEPFGDSSSIPTYYVSKYTREKVKMALTGDGGDEVLSGYNSYLGIKISEKYNNLPGLLKSSIPVMSSFLGRFTTGSPRYLFNRMTNVASTAAMPFKERIINKMAYADYALIKDLVGDITGMISIEDYMDQLMAGCTFKSDFYKLMYFNFKHSLPDDYLVKVDRMSMANSLETRVPFLDPRLIEFMVKVDKNIKLQGWERKSILRKTFGKELPPSLLKAPKKGFGIPIREWFKDDSFQDSLNELINTDLLKLDPVVIQKIIHDNRTGKADYGNFLWGLFSLKQVLSD